MRVNIPPVTRVLLVLATALSFLYQVARNAPYSSSSDTSLDKSTRANLVSYLALVPSVSIFRPWTLVTATFVEQNVLTYLINVSAIFFGGKYFERAWGSREFAWVIAVASIIPNILIVPTYAIWGAVSNSTTRASTPIAGAITLQAAFLVAFKQLIPEHTVSIYRGVVKMRVKHFPAIFLLLNTLSGIIIGTDTAVCLAWYGLVTTWIYLRFFKRQPDLSGIDSGGAVMRGDASETFAFATFFPNIIQPPIAAVCDQVYAVLCNMKILTPFSEAAIATGNENVVARSEVGLPSLTNSARSARGLSKREEAERRRALALKALDQRLNASTSRGPVTSASVSTATVDEQHSLGQTDYKPDEA